MTMAKIGDMTLEELKKVIDEAIDERLTQMLGSFEIEEDDDEEEEMTWDEIRAEVEKHRWTPPAGAKSSLEFLREDRDS
jgi:hypothetical protein